MFCCPIRIVWKEEKLLGSCYWLAQYLSLCLCLFIWNMNLKGFCVSWECVAEHVFGHPTTTYLIRYLVFDFISF